MATAKTVEKYQFDVGFERAVVYLSCSRPRFYGRIGRALDSQCMVSEAATLAMDAAHAIAKDNGAGSDSPGLVIQRLNRWRHEGKVTHEQVIAVNELFDAVEDGGGVPQEDSVVNELRPILQRRLHQEAVKMAMDEYGKRRDFQRVVEIINRANALGMADMSLGSSMGAAAFDVIDSLRHLERLPLGITELDIALGGGVPRGQMPVFVGSPGGGKSMQLSHTGAYAAMSGLFVAYATLELPSPVILARLAAGITGITIDSIMEGNEQARSKLASTPLGPCFVKDFTPQVTTVDDIGEWVKQLEETQGRPVDVLIVDYADKLTTKAAPRDKDKGQYRAMELVYEGLRVFGATKKMWVMTASQAGRRDKDSKKKLDLEHVADSLNKVRVADLVITLNVSDDNDEVTFFIAKNRTGKSRLSIGPLPTDFACGLIAPIIRPDSDNPTREILAVHTEAALANPPETADPDLFQ